MMNQPSRETRSSKFSKLTTACARQYTPSSMMTSNTAASAIRRPGSAAGDRSMTEVRVHRARRSNVGKHIAADDRYQEEERPQSGRASSPPPLSCPSTPFLPSGNNAMEGQLSSGRADAQGDPGRNDWRWRDERTRSDGLEEIRQLGRGGDLVGLVQRCELGRKAIHRRLVDLPLAEALIRLARVAVEVANDLGNRQRIA
jgi:hypothetical protein